MSKRVISTVLGIGIVAVSALAMPGAATAKQNKVDVCHHGDDGWELISIAEPAVDAHLAHGDGLPDGDVPGTEGNTFGADCTPQDGSGYAKEGCFQTSEGFFTPTDGTNPQLLTGVGAEIFHDAECTEFGAVFGAEHWVAWIWEPDQTTALATCQALDGTDISAQAEPNLWLCYYIL